MAIFADLPSKLQRRILLEVLRSCNMTCYYTSRGDYSKLLEVRETLERGEVGLNYRVSYTLPINGKTV